MARPTEESDWPAETPDQRARRKKTEATPVRERGATDVYQAISQHRNVGDVTRERTLTERMDTARRQAARRGGRRGAR